MLATVDTSKIRKRKEVIEAHIKSAKDFIMKLEGIETLEDLRKLRDTTEKSITYDQARLEELDFILLNMTEADSPSRQETTERTLNGSSTITLRDAKTIDADFEPVRYDDGVVAVADTVRKRINMIPVGKSFRPEEVITFLVDRSVITMSQKSNVGKTLRAMPNLKKVSMGVYQRTA